MNAGARLFRPSEGEAYWAPTLPPEGVRWISKVMRGALPITDHQSPSAVPEELRVGVGEVTLSLLRWPGAGPLLVFLHGLNNNAWIWARLAALMRGKREIVAVTLRGHGSSSAPARGYSLADTTRDLTALFEKLAPGRSFDLVGHSWGGKVATHFAAAAGERVRSLILADPAPPQGLNRLLKRFPSLVTAALKPERGPFASRAAWESAARSIVYLQRWDEIDRRLWAESFREHPDGSWHHHLPENAYREILRETLAEDITPLLSRIRCPVLLIRPALSVSFLPGEIEPMRRGFSKLTVRRLWGDHSFLHTNPIDSARIIASFLDELAAQAQAACRAKARTWKVEAPTREKRPGGLYSHPLRR